MRPSGGLICELSHGVVDPRDPLDRDAEYERRPSEQRRTESGECRDR
jgi:hypothetical protein